MWAWKRLQHLQSQLLPKPQQEAQRQQRRQCQGSHQFRLSSPAQRLVLSRAKQHQRRPPHHGRRNHLCHRPHLPRQHLRRPHHHGKQRLPCVRPHLLHRHTGHLRRALQHRREARLHVRRRHQCVLPAKKMASKRHLPLWDPLTWKRLRLISRQQSTPWHPSMQKASHCQRRLLRSFRPLGTLLKSNRRSVARCVHRNAVAANI